MKIKLRNLNDLEELISAFGIKKSYVYYSLSFERMSELSSRIRSYAVNILRAFCDL